MQPKLRDFFDLRLERVLAEMPESIHRLLEEVPLYVEDYPSAKTLAEVGAAGRDTLCGLYTGVPLPNRSVDQGATLPDAVTIYRHGILRAAEDGLGRLTEAELLRQIRITVLHELAHHHGIGETELEELGYG